jgi:hypothetical protein
MGYAGGAQWRKRKGYISIYRGPRLRIRSARRTAARSRRRLSPLLSVPLPCIARRSDAAVENRSVADPLVNHDRLVATLAVPDPGAGEECLRLIRSTRRADPAKQDDSPPFAVMGECRPAAGRRALGRDTLPCGPIEPPGIGRPRTSAIGRDSPVDQDPSIAVFKRVVISRRDVAKSLPAAPIALPAVPDHLPGGAITELAFPVSSRCSSVTTGVLSHSACPRPDWTRQSADEDSPLRHRAGSLLRDLPCVRTTRIVRGREMSAQGPRTDHAVGFYDSRVRRVVLVGGAGDPMSGDRDSVWTWSGTRWELLRIANYGLSDGGCAA